MNAPDGDCYENHSKKKTIIVLWVFAKPRELPNPRVNQLDKLKITGAASFRRPPRVVSCGWFREPVLRGHRPQWPCSSLNMRRPVLIDESVVAPPMMSSRKLMYMWAIVKRIRTYISTWWTVRTDWTSPKRTITQLK